MSTAPKLTGLGDAAALIAKPVARLIDAALGTDLEHCDDCEQRRQRWNEAVPFQSQDVLPNETNESTPQDPPPCMNCGRK